MTQYKDIRRRVLELMNQYSVAGERISPAYNNQSDYISRIPGLINDALFRILTEARPHVGTCSYPGGDGTRHGNMRRHTLPRGCRGIKTGGVYRSDDNGFKPCGDYRLVGENLILFPDDGAEYIVEYYRKPERLTDDPSDEYEIDEDAEVLAAACYYAAAMLTVDKNEYQYAALYNEFLRRMEGMTTPPTAEISTVADVYGGC